MVADVYARFCEHRQKESDEHLRTLTATTLSLDATFRAASKASIVNDDRSRSSIFNGGLHTAVNQKSLIVAYASLYSICLHCCRSYLAFHSVGLKRRLALLNVDDPWAIVVDNCCHFRNAILQVFSDAVVVQDVWHVIMRYMVCVLGGTKNPHRREVAEDISSALIKAKAHDGIPARYWSKEEQEERLVKCV
uniref:Amino acid permease family protein n=1 Tax=Ganoderma boninense TaxID=34458 RepID=A0A5K1K7Q7_9APHY|nr:Amino acid permease family protein [Ganoderma boninense]